MKLKKFNQYINEDYSSEYNIENPPVNDGDDLTTQDDESEEMGEEDMEDMEDMGDEHMEHDMPMDLKSELSNLDKEVLKKIIAIAQELIGNDMDDSEEVEDIETEEFDDDDDDDMDNDMDNDMDDDGIEVEKDTEKKFYPEMSLEESLKFKNFKRRK